MAIFLDLIPFAVVLVFAVAAAADPAAALWRRIAVRDDRRAYAQPRTQ